jgi:membrane protein
MMIERTPGVSNATALSAAALSDSPPSTLAASSSGLARSELAPGIQGSAHRVAWPETLWAFWTKINNDWIFNLSGLLAYNFLAALFPLLLLLLAGCGAILQRLSPSTDQQLQRTLAAALPGSTGAILVAGVETDLKKSIGMLLVVGLLSALVTGSRLFVTLEGCFGIVFRLRGRDPLRQNRMAFSMLLLFLVSAPLIFLVSILPAGLVALVDPGRRSPIGGVLIGGLRLLILFATALLFFGATYAFVPNRRLRWRSWSKNWQGTLVASVLLMLYEPLFGLYQRRLLHADNYGSVAAFAIVIILFLYYLAFILLLGAEINSWVAGQRETAADLPGILHAVQAHRSLRGAAGPTAGRPAEEMQWHSRAWPVRYIEAVLRRARGGHPLTLRLPRHRHAPDQILMPPENEVTP